MTHRLPGFDAFALGGVATCVAIKIGFAFVEGRKDIWSSIYCSTERKYPPCGQLISQHHIDELEYRGFVVIDDVLSHGQLDAAIFDAQSLKKELFSPILEKNGLKASYRSDFIHFLTEADRENTQPGIQKDDMTEEGIIHAQLLLRGVGHQLQLQGFRGFVNRLSPDYNDDGVVKGSDVVKGSEGVCHLSVQDAKPKDLSRLSLPGSVQLAYYRTKAVDDCCGSFYKPHRDGIGGGRLGYGQSSANHTAESSLHPHFQNGLLNYLQLTVFRKRYLTAILYLNNTQEAAAVCEKSKEKLSEKSNEKSIGPKTSDQLSHHEWEKSDGGMLRLYLRAKGDDTEGTSATTVKEIAPLGGRMVLFDSKEMLHEVLPTHRERIALTVWFLL